jgi:two-component system, cell cycle response regulator DivK
VAAVILIVDDNEHLRDIFAHVLHLYGYQTVEATTGIEAIEKTKSIKPNLILLDIDLPDMSGVDVVRAIKKDAVTGKIPIIGCSAFMEFREAALDAGMIDYLIKPVSEKLLTEKVAELTQIHTQ